jgi:hypothetical protein
MFANLLGSNLIIEVSLMKFGFSFWTKMPHRRKRIVSIIMVFIVAFIATVIGSVLPIDSQTANTISTTLNQTLAQHQIDNTLVQYIFLNNFSICLLMFVPIVGAALGLLILFDTGVALAAIATTQGYPVWIGLLSLVVTPIFWIEFVSYSLAMAESIWLFKRLISLKCPIVRRELRWLVIFIGTTAGLLALGAVIEVLIINLAG